MGQKETERLILIILGSVAEKNIRAPAHKKRNKEPGCIRRAGWEVKTGQEAQRVNKPAFISTRILL